MKLYKQNGEWIAQYAGVSMSDTDPIKAIMWTLWKVKTVTAWATR